MVTISKVVKSVKAIGDSPTLQAIPGVGIIASASYDAMRITDKILYKKAENFIKQLSNDLTPDEIESMMDRFYCEYSTVEEQKEFGEHLVEYLNSMNHSYKGNLSAKVFEYWMKSSIDKNLPHSPMSENDFYHVLDMIAVIPIDVLKAFEEKYHKDSYGITHDKYSLMQYGIYNLKVDTNTISQKMGEAVNFGVSSHSSDDLLSQTKHGRILADALWNGKMPEDYKREESAK